MVAVDIPFETIMDVLTLLGVAYLIVRDRLIVRKLISLATAFISANEVNELIDRKMAEREGDQAAHDHIEKEFGGEDGDN